MRAKWVETESRLPQTAAYLRVSNDIKQGDDVGATGQVLKNLDLSLDLLLLDRLQDLDDAFLVVHNVDAFEHFGILSAA